MKVTRNLLCGLFAVGFMSTGALAQSSGAHYQKSSTSASISLKGDETGDLVVSWVEAGLGSYDVNYTLTGNVSAVYFCRTKSGNIPDASNKHTANSSQSAGGTFQVKNGKVTGSLTLEEPVAPVSDPPTCGGGQSLDIQSITWTNVVLTDTTYNDVYNFGTGTFSTTFYPAP